MNRVLQNPISFNQAEGNLIEKVMTPSWEYTDADTQYLTHNIHRYSGKFIPQIAARAISLLTSPGEFVVDPYCGSGTTLLEAALLGRRGFGVDLNPLALLIARTKVTPVSREDINSLYQEVETTLAPLLTKKNKSLLGYLSDTSTPPFEARRDSRSEDKWYRKWFQPKILEGLLAIDYVIHRITDPRKRDIARVAFSDILRKSSNAKSNYPNIMFDKNTPERESPIRPFLKSLNRVGEMVASLEKMKARWQDVQAQQGDATALPLQDASADAIITHPPYIGSIPYAEYGALSLTWLGVSPKKLDEELTGGQRQSRKVVERFQEGYSRMLMESSRILRHGRYAFLMVGNPTVRGAVIDLASMTITLAERAGLRLVVRTERTGVNRRANKMSAEHLLFFKKEGTH